METRFRSLRSGLKWSTVNAVGTILSKVFRGAVIPKLLDPASYGLFTSVGIFTRYLQFSDFGAAAYFTKTLPHAHFNLGEAEERRLADRAYTLILLSNIPVLLYLGGAALLYRGTNPGFYKLALPLLIPITIASKLKEFHVGYAMGIQDYRKAALASVVYNYVSLAAVVAGVLWRGALGGIVGMFVSEWAVCAWVARASGRRLRFVWGRELLQGWGGHLRLFLVSMAETVAATLDQIFILRVFDAKGLGFYGLGLTFGWVLESLSEIFNNTFYPKLMAMARTDREGAEAFLHRTLHCYLLASLALVPMLMWAIEVVVGHYFVRYQEGLAVYHIMIFLGLARGAMSIIRRAYVAFDREAAYIAFSLVSSGAFVAGLLLAKVRGLGFGSVVLVILLVNVLSLGLFYLRMTRGWSAAFWKNLGLMSAVLATLALFQWGVRTVPGAMFQPSAALAYLAGLLLLALAWVYGERDLVLHYIQ